MFYNWNSEIITVKKKWIYLSSSSHVWPKYCMVHLRCWCFHFNFRGRSKHKASIVGIVMIYMIGLTFASCRSNSKGWQIKVHVSDVKVLRIPIPYHIYHISNIFYQIAMPHYTIFYYRAFALSPCMEIKTTKDLMAMLVHLSKEYNYLKLLFLYTNMVAVTSCANALWKSWLKQKIRSGG